MRRFLCFVFLFLLILCLAGCEEISKKELAIDMGLQDQKFPLIQIMNPECKSVNYIFYEGMWRRRHRGHFHSGYNMEVEFYFMFWGKDFSCKVPLRNVTIEVSEIAQVSFHFSDCPTLYNNREYYRTQPNRLVEEGCKITLYLSKEEGTKLKLRIAQQRRR